MFNENNGSGLDPGPCRYQFRIRLPVRTDAAPQPVP
jgi:hypothetical protein